MATYYVRSDGNDANTGLGSTTNLAWKTIQKALSATGIGSGDTLYIAPGTYTEAVVIGGTYSAPTYVIGNPTASMFTGINPGVVNHTGLNAAGTATVTNSSLISGTTKSNLRFSYIYWSNNVAGGGGDLVRISGRYNEFASCVFESMTYNSANLYLTALTSQPLNAIIDKCIFYRGSYWIRIDGGSNQVDTTSITSSLFVLQSGGAYPIDVTSVQTKIYNCTMLNTASYSFVLRSGSATNFSTFYNNIAPGTLFVDVANSMVENNNRFVTGRQGTIAVGSNTTNAGTYGIDIGQSLLFGITNSQIHTTSTGSPNTSYGTSTSAPATDLYSIAWSGSSPDAGSGTYRSITTVGQYNPTERNASTITIAPGSTSQSIELYLGATGLTASTSGLSAYYNRTRSADVQIPLVARTIGQAWTSGGFAEVNANTMPGVYRLDIPNEALAAGADDVTVVVRGASGTNGAVMSIKLSSGGLTSAQTASAVWDAATTSYTNNGSFGLNLLRADQQNKQGLVTLSSAGNVNRVDADVHAIANDIAAATALKGALNHDGTGYVDSDVVRISTSTAAANELEGALLHNGTDYIDSNLLSGNSTRVFVGRFQLTQTGTTQGDIIEAFTTDTPSFELQLFDGDNNIVPVTGATLGLRILDVTSTVVETGTPTIEYGTGGIVRWTAPGSYVSIGCPAGMYRLFVDRTVSGTTTTFGPLQIKVQVQ